MIRFLNLEDQICAGEKHFAFYDTVSGTICSFGGEQVFSSVEDFECAHREEQTIRPISRFLSLIPEGKWLHTGKKLPSSPDFDTWIEQTK